MLDTIQYNCDDIPPRTRPSHSDFAIRPLQDKPPHYYCYPKIDDDDHWAVLYCLGSNYLHAGSWISYFNTSNSTALPCPEFRELYFNCLGLHYTRS
ncbi:hypothetical protein RclHR1_11780006 [Rhizophagus clarus]|uniref:Uncharacterized protein n=1 Tax=Rhizophagus clarus TaxID=94130 RepID=A0A2Z6QKC6_9GLOM|nr:hypothetical protein RclHR1_11780006 [Rhizophagus clarus]GES99767.1 hypothetical protein RCL_e21127_RclHR1_11780006 [Rhizophagus clarus]